MDTKQQATHQTYKQTDTKRTDTGWGLPETREVGGIKRIKGVGNVVTKREQTWGGEHTVQCTDTML